MKERKEKYGVPGCCRRTYVNWKVFMVIFADICSTNRNINSNVCRFLFRRPQEITISSNSKGAAGLVPKKICVKKFQENYNKRNSLDSSRESFNFTNLQFHRITVSLMYVSWIFFSLCGSRPRRSRNIFNISHLLRCQKV